jgi:hypothetical protein
MIVVSALDEVERYETDIKVSDQDFDIEFPAGTLVMDERPQPGIGRTGTLDYLVMPSGDKRIITWDERHATYKELQETPSGMAGLKRRNHQGLSWFLVANVVLLAALLILVLIRRRVKKSAM